MAKSPKAEKTAAALSRGAANRTGRITVAEFGALSVKEKIGLVRSLLEVGAELDPGGAVYVDVGDTVVVERDSQLSGGLTIAYFFRDPVHLAAARWAARQEMTNFDLDELDADVDLDQVETIFSGQLAEEKTVFEGSVAELLQGKDGAEVRARWPENRFGRPLPDEIQQRRFLYFIRTGETPDDEAVDLRPLAPGRKSKCQLPPQSKAAPALQHSNAAQPAKSEPVRGYFCEQCDAFHETEETPDRVDAWLYEGEDGLTSNDVCEHYEEGVLECDHDRTDAWELQYECLVAEDLEVEGHVWCHGCGSVHS